MAKKIVANGDDRELARIVRYLTLAEIEKILRNPKKDKKMFQAVILRLAPTVLPRITELTGEKGTPIVIQIAEAMQKKYDTNAGAKSDTVG